jgi:hypothetical protein
MHLIHSTSELASIGRRTVQTAAATDLLRRVDWRFLLPNPAPGRVLIIGDETKNVVEACRTIFENVEHAPDASQASQASCELIVAVDLTPALAKQIIGARNHCSLIYGELPEEIGRRPFRRLSSLQAQFVAAGFSEVTFYWHYPDFDHCTHIFSCGEPTSLRWYARRRRGFLHQFQSLILGIAITTGLLPYLVKSLSITAMRNR